MKVHLSCHGRGSAKWECLSSPICYFEAPRHVFPTLQIHCFDAPLFVAKEIVLDRLDLVPLLDEVDYEGDGRVEHFPLTCVGIGHQRAGKRTSCQTCKWKDRAAKRGTHRIPNPRCKVTN